jgi:hypothetical protein
LPDSIKWLWLYDNPDLDINSVRFKDGSTALEREASGALLSLSY